MNTINTIDEFEQTLSNVPGLYVKCDFDKSGKLIDIDCHPVYQEMINKMMTMKNPPIYGIFRVVAYMCYLAEQNHCDAKSCRVFFEAITCGVAAKNGIGPEQYHNELAKAGYYGTKQ